MKHLFFLSVGLIMVFGFVLKTGSDNPLIGSWETFYQNEDGEDVQISVIIQDSFIVETLYNKVEKKFFQTMGGTWEDDGKTIKINLRFHSADENAVGKSISLNYVMKDKLLKLEGDSRDWKKVDEGNTSPLHGAWFFSGRKRNGEMSRRPMRPRKTMKILSDTRFQWIAYNDETGVFSGTGGGTYTAVDGRYTENIEFFSRDGERVGASLGFDFEVKDGEWNHSGFSSKGDPMFEIWAPYGMIPTSMD